MKAKALVCFLLVGAVLLFSAQQLVSAQVSNGMRRGFTVTDADDPNPNESSHRVFAINLDNAEATIQRGLSGAAQELEGLFSVDNLSTGRSSLFGVAETPDGTGSPLPSNCVNLTAAAVDPNGVGVEVGLTGVNFGTEAGAAWDHTIGGERSGNRYAIFSDDRDLPPSGDVDFPATMLVVFNEGGCASGFTIISINNGIYLDGLAVGGDGTLYATDGRLTDSLYRYNFDELDWELVGAFGGSFNEDTGLANYRGLGGNETNLYMITEGDGALLGRLWTVCHDSSCGTPGQATLVGNITMSGVEVPEDLEGFEIPYFPLVNEQ